MLVLTRKSQEQIRIGNDIVITILRVKGNSVRVGIEAPRDVRVVRGELPPKRVQVPTEVVEVCLSGVERLELTQEAPSEAAPSGDATPAELLEQSLQPPRRTLKDYVASTISHAV